MTDERLNLLKNKISLELKDVSTQQGFEVICKRLEEAEKENAELKQQVDKMKCCENCKHDVLHYIINSFCPCDVCNDNDKWELKEK